MTEIIPDLLRFGGEVGIDKDYRGAQGVGGMGFLEVQHRPVSSCVLGCKAHSWGQTAYKHELVPTLTIICTSVHFMTVTVACKHD